MKKMSSTEININKLMNSLFFTNTTPEALDKYIRLHLNFSNKNCDTVNISFPFFYNVMELPLFISEMLYNSFISIYNDCNSNNFIKFLNIMYLGNLDERIKFLFSILNMEKLNKINISNIKIFFSHLKAMEKTTEKEMEKGYFIIEDFFNKESDITFEEFKSRIINENTDLIYLFFFLLIKFCPINRESFIHYQKKFLNNNEGNQKEFIEKLKNKYYSLPFPTEIFQEFLNFSFGFNFIINDEISLLNEFETDLQEIKHFNSLPSLKNNFIYIQKNLFNYSEKKNSMIFKKINRKSVKDLISISNKSCLFEIENQNTNQENYTFHCYVLKKNKFISCSFDIIGKDIFIYTENLNLTFLIPIEKLYIEFGDKKNEIIDENAGDFRIPIFFNSFLFENKSKKYILYFNNNKNFEKIKNLIIKNQKFKPPNFNKYKFEKRVGKGSFGEIFKYYITENKKYVAVKKIQKINMFENKNYFDKWEKDICFLLKNYPCPYIVEIYDIFEDNDYIYIMQEFANKGNLEQYIEMNKENDKISKDEKYQIIRDIARAIEFLHSLGIVHRDLKCENILLSEKLNKYNFHQIKIIDFGLSEIVTINRKLRKRFGTMIYIPPEIILEQSYNDTIDIWAFGIISYMVLNKGNHPFINNDIQNIDNEIFNNIINNEMSKFDFGEKYKIIFSCLSKISENRPNISEVTKKFQSLIKTKN